MTTKTKPRSATNDMLDSMILELKQNDQLPANFDIESFSADYRFRVNQLQPKDRTADAIMKILQELYLSALTRLSQATDSVQKPADSVYTLYSKIIADIGELVNNGYNNLQKRVLELDPKENSSKNNNNLKNILKELGDKFELLQSVDYKGIENLRKELMEFADSINEFSQKDIGKTIDSSEIEQFKGRLML